MRHIALCFATGVLIAACGTKGPLYLPPQTPPAKPVMTVVKERIWTPKAECKTDCGNNAAGTKASEAMVQGNNNKAPATKADPMRSDGADPAAASSSTESQPAAK